MAKIKIETMVGCNASCLFCPLGVGILKRKRGRMNSDFFFEIVDQAIELGFNVAPYVMGEPLIESRIFEFFDYIKSKGGKQTISTNASLITKDIAKRLSRYQYNEFIISFHGGNKKDYEKVMGLNFEKAISNIKYLISLGKIPNYKISMQVCEENKNSIVDFKNLWKGHKVNMANIVNWAGCLSKGKGIRKCSYLYVPNIFWDGRMSLCCCDAEGLTIIGDLKKQSLREILSGQIYQKYIDFNRKAKLNELYPCNICDAK